MKVVLYANSDWYLYNFRRSLVQRLLDRGDEVLLLSPDGPYGDRLSALGARWRPLDMDRRSLNPAAELALLITLTRILREEQPDLVHGFTIKGAVYGALAARFAGVRRRILAVAGLGYVFSNQGLKARILRPLVRLAMRLAFAGADTRLILQNSEDAGFFRRSGLIEPRRIRLIPGSGVDCRRFAPRTVPRPGPFRVGLAARLLRDKGVEDFVEASRRLRARGRAIEFVLAGAPDPGNPDSVTQAQVEAWVSEGAISWSGHVEDMPAFLASIDALILPTRYGEGVPRSLVEAGACGLPVVATTIAGCRELVSDGDNGLLVEPGDLDALADAIDRLSRDRDLAARMGAAGRARVIEKFSDEVVLAGTLGVYQELMLETAG